MGDMGNFFTINRGVLASSARAAAALRSLEPDQLKESLPELNILGGALKAAGVSNADEFIRVTSGLEQASPDSGDPVVIQKRLSEILEGSGKKKWKGVKRVALQTIRYGKAPDGTIVVTSTRFKIAAKLAHALTEHPLGSTVLNDVEPGYLRILFRVILGAPENKIGGLIQKGDVQRLAIFSTTTGNSKNDNRAFKAFLIGVLGDAGPTQISLHHSPGKPDRKSIIVPANEILKVLDRLNEIGPRLVSTPQLQAVEGGIARVREHFKTMTEGLSQAQDIVTNVPTQYRPEPQVILGEVISIVRDTQNRLQRMDTIERGPSSIVFDQLRELQQLTSAVETNRAAFDSLMSRLVSLPSVMRAEAKRLVDAAQETVEELGRHLGALESQLSESEAKLSDDNTKKVASLKAQLGGAKTVLASIEETLVDGTLATWQDLQRKAKAIIAIKEGFVGQVEEIEESLSLLNEVLVAAANGNGYSKEVHGQSTANYPEKYHEVIPLLEALEHYIEIRNASGLTELDKANAEVSRYSKRATRETQAAFGVAPDYWPASIPNDLQYLVHLSQQMRNAQREAQKALSEAKKGIQTDLAPGRIKAYLISGFHQVKSVLGDLGTDTETLFIHPTLRSIPPKKIERSLQQKLEDTYTRIDTTIIHEKGKPFLLTEERLANLEDVRKNRMPYWKRLVSQLRVETDTLVATVSEEDWTDEMKNLSKIINMNLATAKKNIDNFAEAHDALLAEWANPDHSEKRVKGFYLEAIHIKTRAGQALGKVSKALTGRGEDQEWEGSIRSKASEEPVRSLTHLIQNPQKVEVQREYKKMGDSTLNMSGREVRVENGIGYVDGVQIILEGSLKAQEKKLRNIVETLVIPKDEEERNVKLAYPLFRAEVQKRMETGEPIRKLFKIDEKRGIAVVYDYRFGTAFYVPYKTGWVIDKPKAMMPMFHGGGGARSTGATMVAPMIKLRKDFGYNAITFDTPNHGYAFVDRRFGNLDEFMGWVDTIVDYFIDLGGGVPVVAIGRSHGDDVLEEYKARYPGKLDGTINVSGYDPDWTKLNEPTLRERVAKGDFKPHQTGLPMVMRHEGLGVRLGGDLLIQFYDEGQNQWTFLDPAVDEIIKKTPALYLSGTKDPEYVEGVPDFYLQRKARAERLGQKMIVIEGGGHDLLALREGEEDRIKIVYDAINSLVEEAIVKFRRSMPIIRRGPLSPDASEK